MYVSRIVAQNVGRYVNLSDVHFELHNRINI